MTTITYCRDNRVGNELIMREAGKLETASHVVPQAESTIITAPRKSGMIVIVKQPTYVSCRRLSACILKWAAL